MPQCAYRLTARALHRRRIRSNYSDVRWLRGPGSSRPVLTSAVRLLDHRPHFHAETTYLNEGNYVSFPNVTPAGEWWILNHRRIMPVRGAMVFAICHLRGSPQKRDTPVGRSVVVAVSENGSASVWMCRSYSSSRPTVVVHLRRARWHHEGFDFPTDRDVRQSRSFQTTLPANEIWNIWSLFWFPWRNWK